MKVRIEGNFATAGHRVWLYDRMVHGLRVLRLPPIGETGGFPYWEDVDSSAAEITPTVELPAGALEALIAEGEEHVPTTSATVDALKDAREVRDRLLALVEEGWHG